MSRADKMMTFWLVLGALVLFWGGWKVFLLWLTPGVPPPGPLG